MFFFHDLTRFTQKTHLVRRKTQNARGSWRLQLLLEAAAGHHTLVLMKRIILACVTHEFTDRKGRTSWQAEIPLPERNLQSAAPPPLCGAKHCLLFGGGISALGLVRFVPSVPSCIMLAKTVFFP